MAVGPMREYAIIEHAQNLERELIALERRESILVDAMSEIKATSDGQSDQPIVDIVAGCIMELSSANASVMARPDGGPNT